MKLTKNDFENVVNGRVELALKETRANKPIMTMFVVAFAIGVSVAYFHSFTIGFVVIVVALIAGVLWNRRNFKRTATRIRQQLSQEWEGYIEP